MSRRTFQDWFAARLHPLGRIRDRSRARRPHCRSLRFEPLEDRLVLALQVGIALDSISENGGVTAATVARIGGNFSLPLTVSLSSSDTTEATVPATVVIAANVTSAVFNVTAVNDAVLDDRVTVTITASAMGHVDATDTVEVINDDLIPLALAPAPDVVTLLPGMQSGEYEVTTGPAVTASLGSPWYAKFSGQSLYQTAGAGVSVQADDFFPVDVTRTYALAGWAKSGDEFGQRFQPGNQQSFGVAAYDVDLLPILPQHVLRFSGATDTTLAAPLNPGATTIQLSDATGWSNAAANLAADARPGLVRVRGQHGNDLRRLHLHAQRGVRRSGRAMERRVH